MRPPALDLFCGAGGVSVGLARAGFDVVGVDSNPKCEPYWRRGMMELYGGQFIVADALDVLRERDWLLQFHLICASPPCQKHTSLRHLHKHIKYVDLIAETRELLVASGIPWCIENVPGAPLGGANLTMLCGTMFGLQTPDGRAELRRHRLFETSFSIPLRPACQHGHAVESVSVTGTGMGVGGRSRWAQRAVLSVAGHSCESPAERHRQRLERSVITVSGDKPNSANTLRVITVTGSTPQRQELHNKERETFSVDDARAAMGIPWMPMRFLSQAIPPAYAEWIGRQALAAADSVRAPGTRRES